MNGYKKAVAEYIKLLRCCRPVWHPHIVIEQPICIICDHLKRFRLDFSALGTDCLLLQTVSNACC